MFTFQSDQGGATEIQMGAIGIAVVTAQAVSVGITAIPHPFTDGSWGGWLWHSYFAAKLFVASAAGIEPQMTHRIVVDSKAARKVDEDERLVVVVENSASNGIEIFTAFRFLSKIY